MERATRENGRVLELLKTHFGYDAFLPLQEEIVGSVMAGRDTFALMPTGGGKSLCYQLPALGLPGLTLVVSPLIALMKDQVDALEANGVPAGFINSTQTAAELSQVVRQVRVGGNQAALRGAGTRNRAPICRLPGNAQRQPSRHRRGPLRVGMGARLPASVPAACGIAPGLPRGSGDCPDRDGHEAGEGRHPRAAGASGPGSLHFKFQPSQPQLLNRSQRAGPVGTPRVAGKVPGRIGDHILRFAEVDRRAGPDAQGARLLGGGLSCGPRRGSPARHPGQIHSRQDARGGGDHCFRHGNQQAGCADGSALRPAEEH